MSERQIITHIEDRNKLLEIINKNNNILVIKFGAEWCGPCKKIEGLVNEWFNFLPQNVTCAKLDADECFDVYAFYKKKRIISTIPAFLRYDYGEDSWAPSEFLFSSDENKINEFFHKIVNDA
tara:strand:+ start:1349 stop:1714 length:366 start_codon:yes stop_codon:yes gene_type:complete